MCTNTERPFKIRYSLLGRNKVHSRKTKWNIPLKSRLIIKKKIEMDIFSSATCVILSQRQILGTGNLPQDSAPVCINIDISPEMAAQSAQRNHAFCVTASDWSPITTA